MLLTIIIITITQLCHYYYLYVNPTQSTLLKKRKNHIVAHTKTVNYLHQSWHTVLIKSSVLVEFGVYRPCPVPPWRRSSGVWWTASRKRWWCCTEPTTRSRRSAEVDFPLKETSICFPATRSCTFAHVLLIVSRASVELWRWSNSDGLAVCCSGKINCGPLISARSHRHGEDV